MNNLEMRLNGKQLDSIANRFYDELLPVGYTFESDRLKSYSVKQEEMTGQKVEIAISFVDKDTHLKDFSTGFIDMSDLAVS
jgi:hypothetical protein